VSDGKACGGHGDIILLETKRGVLTDSAGSLMSPNGYKMGKGSGERMWGVNVGREK
jgi:hypothetical protein